MPDLDHVQQIDDGYGHGRGDEVLAAVGAALAASVRGTGFAGRYGGAEFLVLLPDTDLEPAAQMADTLRTSLARCRSPTALQARPVAPVQRAEESA